MAGYTWVSEEHKAAFDSFIPSILKFTQRQKLGSSKTMEIKVIDYLGVVNYILDNFKAQIVAVAKDRKKEEKTFADISI